MIKYLPWSLGTTRNLLLSHQLGALLTAVGKSTTVASLGMIFNTTRSGFTLQHEYEEGRVTEGCVRSSCPTTTTVRVSLG